MGTPRKPGTGPTEQGVPTKRGRRRVRIIERSEHRGEYDVLIRSGWSSYSLEKYAKFRYGEDIPSRTWRDYIAKLEGSDLAERARPEAHRLGVDPFDPDRLVDVLALRTELIALQRERIAIDAGHERTMRKLFSTTSREIQLLSQLVDAVKGDMQDLGLFPTAGAVATLNVQHSAAPDQARVPRYATLADALGDARPDVEVQVARMLHDVLPELTGGNGQVVDGEVG